MNLIKKIPLALKNIFTEPHSTIRYYLFVKLNYDKIFENKDSAPNHISFLADGTNQAMIEFLSPLLPVAQVLGIPVLDFDKYKISQDSQPTANVVIPLVTSYLKQNMSL